MSVVVDNNACVGCGACVDSCPVNAITMKDGKATIDDGTCVNCGACIGNCPTEALSL
jgi:ferredoxin